MFNLTPPNPLLRMKIRLERELMVSYPLESAKTSNIKEKPIKFILLKIEPPFKYNPEICSLVFIDRNKAQIQLGVVYG